jgi:small subunit ribosomal protein S11
MLIQKKEYKMLKIKKLNKKYAFLVAIVYVYSTFNNTIITVTSISGKVLIFGSSGLLGLKGANRSSSYASESIANVLSKKITELNIQFILIRLKGFGNSRKFVLNGFKITNFIKIISIKDFTSLAHNGSRSKKKRRI